MPSGRTTCRSQQQLFHFEVLSHLPLIHSQSPQTVSCPQRTFDSSGTLAGPSLAEVSLEDADGSPTTEAAASTSAAASEASVGWTWGSLGKPAAPAMMGAGFGTSCPQGATSSPSGSVGQGIGIAFGTWGHSIFSGVLGLDR